MTESPRKVLGEVDGVLLTGGGDVDPVFYGEDRHPLTDDAEPGRDEFEIDLARRAMTDDVPLLAICRGAQVLNVAAGGTLVQDIPSAVESGLTHAVKEPKNLDCHEIEVVAGTRLSSVLGRQRRRRLQLPRQQPASPVGRQDRQRPRRQRPRRRRRRRSDRKTRRRVLHRRAVASGELLGVGRVPAALRRVRRCGVAEPVTRRGSEDPRRHIRDSGPPSRHPWRPGLQTRVTNTPSDSTCGVFGNRSKAVSDASSYPPSTRRRASRAIVAGSHDT